MIDSEKEVAGVFSRRIALCFLLLTSAVFIYASPESELLIAPRVSQPEVPALPVRLVVMPESPRPGEPVTIGLLDDTSSSAGVKVSLLNEAGTALSAANFFNLGETIDGRAVKAAIIAVPSTVAAGAARLQVSRKVGNEARVVLVETPLIIAKRDFIHEDIPVPQTSADLLTIPDPKKTEEAEILWAILSHTGADLYSFNEFIVPVTTKRITNPFGTEQVFIYPNKERRPPSIHAGIDYGVPTGTPVLSCAAGKVLLARPRIITGNTVIVEHLPGVYSLYYHLDKIAVSENAFIEQGVPVGLSGATGFVTGPHLHWEVRVSGVNTDPDAFIARAVLDTELLLNALRL
jgi:murein DD-endopeptidase MepM/ murein hydrolase activator NlpD